MNETNLCVLYEIASRKPGWLSKLETIFMLTPEETGFLCWLDDQESKMNKKLREMEAQMSRDGYEPELIDCETDDERMVVVGKLIATLEDMQDDLRKLDKPYLERGLSLLVHRYDHWIKLRKKIRARMIYTQNPTLLGFTSADLERARAVPLESIVERGRNKMMICPFHDDKTPSMRVEGFGWCYSCNAWCDSIKYMVEIRKMKFIDAVNALARL